MPSAHHKWSSGRYHTTTTCAPNADEKCAKGQSVNNSATRWATAGPAASPTSRWQRSLTGLPSTCQRAARTPVDSARRTPRLSWAQAYWAQ